ncbi:Protein sax-3 [Trichinella britovi]|uniref:Protein sax-3 n=1 Tax=Trichinella britovi TaxID=45882 RepID=A0A0V1C8G6_TRIBR|nr:Protein sax-3 [Trichinella britovi]
MSGGFVMRDWLASFCFAVVILTPFVIAFSSYDDAFIGVKFVNRGVNGLLKFEVTTVSPGPPQILEHPSDEIVAAGDSVTLNCKATGNPQPQVIWFKDGKPLVTAAEESDSTRVILPSGSLFLMQAVNQGRNRNSDAGVYWCVVRNGRGEARSRNATLKIAWLKEEFRVHPKPVTAVVGKQALLECSPPNGYPEPVVSWKKDNQDLNLDGDSRRTVHSSGNLIITNVQTSDSGFYSCVARNLVQERVSKTGRLLIYEKPEIKIRPDDIAVDVGSEALFLCAISGDPKPDVQWRKANGVMPAGRSRMLADYSLKIDRIVASDEGEYICSGKNAAGAVEASAKLVVQSPPWFTDGPRDVDVKEGSEISLLCEANGSPPPSLFWSKEGAQELMFPGFRSVDGRVQVSKKGDLSIQHVISTDEGNYVCTALNAAGSNSAKAFVRVTVDGDDMSSDLPPLIIRGPANQTLPLDSVAVMPCLAKSTGETYDIVWLKNGVQIEPSDRFNILSGGNLNIRDLRKEDSALYTCSVKSHKGEDQVSAFLRVEAHTNPNVIFERMPEPSTFSSPPGRPRVINVSDTEVTLQWMSPDNAGASSILGYRLQYYSPQMGSYWASVVDLIRSPMFVVRRLKPSSSYVFVVRAVNHHGISEPSLFSSVVRTKSVGFVRDFIDIDLEVARKSLSDVQLVKLREVKAINETSVKLSWKLLRTEPLITGFYIRWQAAETNQQGLVNVTNFEEGPVWSRTIGGLKPYTKYLFFITPYFRSVEGNPSNVLDVLTTEAVPTAPPGDMQIRMTNLTTLRVSWKPPPLDQINGILRGYTILVIANETRRILRNITASERAASVTLFHLEPGTAYRIRVGAFTTAGSGRQFCEGVVTMDEATLRSHLTMEALSTPQGRLNALLQEPWFISVIGAAVWSFLILLVAVFWWRRRRAYKKTAEHECTNGPFIKINDGSVLNTGREALWIDPQQFYQSGGSHPATLAVASLSTRYLMGAESPRLQPAPVFFSTKSLERPYTELSQMNYSLGGVYRPSNASSSYYHQIPSLDVPGNAYYCPTSPPSPTPYATTTLVMNAHRQRQQQQLELQQQHHQTMQLPLDRERSKHSTVVANMKRAGSLVSPEHNNNNKAVNSNSNNNNNNNNNNSPPQTDVSLLAGGTNSSNGNSRKIRAHQPTLLDFIPPPPTQPPPPVTDEMLAQSAVHFAATENFYPLKVESRRQPQSTKELFANGGIGANSSSRQFRLKRAAEDDSKCCLYSQNDDDDNDDDDDDIEPDMDERKLPVEFEDDDLTGPDVHFLQPSAKFSVVRPINNINNNNKINNSSNHIGNSGNKQNLLLGSHPRQPLPSPVLPSIYNNSKRSLPRQPNARLGPKDVV